MSRGVPPKRYHSKVFGWWSDDMCWQFWEEEQAAEASERACFEGVSIERAGCIYCIGTGEYIKKDKSKGKCNFCS